MAGNIRTAAHYTDITIVLIGTIGSGKSRTGNTIVGSEEFTHEIGSIPVTKKISHVEVDIPDSEHDQLHLTVIDTPGLKKIEEFSKLQKEIKRLTRGLCVYLFVIPFGRFQSDDGILLEGLFKKETRVGLRTGIVLTRMAELNGYTPDQWIEKVATLKRVIDDKHLQFIAIENNLTDGQSLKCLIKLIKDLYNKEIQHDNSKTITVTLQEITDRFGKAGTQFFCEICEKQIEHEKGMFCSSLPFFPSFPSFVGRK